jgi:REP element-mobilizing transposase RayT
LVGSFCFGVEAKRVSSRAGQFSLAAEDSRHYTGPMVKGRPPRLREIFQSLGEPLFFVTMCTLHRQRFPSLRIIQESLRDYAERGVSNFNVAVGRYVVMPDHLHLFVRGDANFALALWVKGLKRTISTASTTWNKDFRWQPGFFDHVLRNEESYAQKWNYVRDNPVRAGLVARAEEWPYQGEVIYIHRA